jgi:adenosyl cobinamide kinase/adenosyl cobinamide phosphate guanylyltransferase
MHFIFGGRGMGMLEYAKGLVADPAVCDLALGGEESLAASNILVNAHLLVKRKVESGEDAVSYFRQILPVLYDKIVIGEEVGSGVVPIDPFEREWRDETGRVYQLLAAEAGDVTRLWAGIPQILKRKGQPNA